MAGTIGLFGIGSVGVWTRVGGVSLSDQMAACNSRERGLA